MYIHLFNIFFFFSMKRFKHINTDLLREFVDILLRLNTYL